MLAEIDWKRNHSPCKDLGYRSLNTKGKKYEISVSKRSIRELLFEKIPFSLLQADD